MSATCGPAPVTAPRVALLLERSAPGRVWNEVVPLLLARGVHLRPVTVFGDDGVADQFRALGVEPVSLKCGSSRDYLRAALDVARLVRRDELDVVHGTEPIPAVIGGLAGTCARRGLRVYHRQHLNFDDKPTLTRLSRLAARLNHVTLACSEAAARAAVELDGTRPARVRVAYNGANSMREVGSDEIAAIRSTLGVPPDAAVIAVVSRLRPEKGLDVLLHAVPVVSKRLSRPVHVVIAGDGPDEDRLRALARQTGHGTVHFVGPQQDVALWFCAGDVVAMPSFREGFGVAAAEAMACARPLVASRVGGLAEIVEDGVTGVLVPPRDKESLGRALADVLLGSRQQREAMGTRARNRYRRQFTNAAMVGGWLSCYGEVTLKRRPE